MVTNAPPSIGQCLIKGRSEILISLKPAELKEDFFGRAFIAASPVLKYLNGFFRAATGLFLNSTIWLIFARRTRNINLLLSKDPNKLLTAIYLLPFTFSNKIAGPFF